MRCKLAGQHRDHQHFLSNRIVDNTKANTLIFGKPKVKKMASYKTGSLYNKKATRTLHHSLQNTGYISRFIEYVTYKAEKAGKRVIRIDEAYTTQICPTCGKMEKRHLSERIIACRNCGYLNDRDLSSSINIMASFLIQKDQFGNLLQEPSVNEELFLQKWKGFLRQTAKGKTKVPMTGFWSRFGGLVEKVLSPVSSSTATGAVFNLISVDKGSTAQVFKTIDAP